MRTRNYFIASLWLEYNARKHFKAALSDYTKTLTVYDDAHPKGYIPAKACWYPFKYLADGFYKTYPQYAKPVRELLKKERDFWGKDGKGEYVFEEQMQIGALINFVLSKEEIDLTLSISWLKE
jgi:hypothetical protein